MLESGQLLMWVCMDSNGSYNREMYSIHLFYLTYEERKKSFFFFFSHTPIIHFLFKEFTSTLLYKKYNIVELKRSNKKT